MDTPTYFYHATSEINEASIRVSKTLIPQKHNPPKDWMWLVNSHRDIVPDGVWFCATLYKKDLPTTSPYGNRRVRIRIADVKQQLGGEVKLYAGVTDQKVGKNTYVRLMLVKENDNFEILQYMEPPLDMAENPWLTLTGGYTVAKRPTWVEIYVPYSINVPDDWDQVNE